MTDIIKNYEIEAERLRARLELLKAELDIERDIDKVNELRKRIQLIKIEIWEILEDIKCMKGYMSR